MIKLLTKTSVLLSALALSACALVDPASTGHPESSEGANLDHDALRTELDQLNRSQRDLCLSSPYTALQTVNPCSNKDISFAQLANDQRITPSQRTQMIALYTELDPIYQKITDLYQNHGGDDAARIIESRNWAFDQSRDNRLQLVHGKVTWGAYLDRRLKINATMNQRIQ